MPRKTQRIKKLMKPGERYCAALRRLANPSTYPSEPEDEVPAILRIRDANPDDVLAAFFDEIERELVDVNEVSTAVMRETDASLFGMVSFDTKSIEMASGAFAFSAAFVLEGEEHEEKPFSGDEVRGRVSGDVAFVDGKWSLGRLRVTRAEHNIYRDDEDGDDDGDWAEARE